MTIERIEVVTFRESLAEDFARLNYAWIEQYFSIEAADRKTLDDPQSSVLDLGGEIFFVLVDGKPAGTVAMTPHEVGVYELAKMAVDPAFQGRGLGHRLMQACIDFARRNGASEIMLVTNDSLDTALGLYRASGFERATSYTDQRYQRGNLEMRLALSPVNQAAAEIE